MISHKFIPLVLSLASLAAACSGTRGYDPHVAVTVSVDFGPADHAAHSGQILIEEGSSPIDALDEVIPMVRGFVTDTGNDVWSVDGVTTDREVGLYWIWKLDGRFASLAPDRYDLKNGDHITWVYTRTDPPDYRRH